MRIAFINQPLNELRIPLRGDSLGIWTYEVARRCTPWAEVRIYARNGPEKRRSVERHEGLDLVKIPVGLDERLHDFANRYPRWLRRVGIVGGPTRPFFATGLYYLPYALRVSFDLRRWLQGGGIVHLHNFSQFVPLIRKLNPRARIVLNMQCEWLSQLDPSIVGRRIRAADVILGCSEYIAAKVRARFPEVASRCHALNNGVDVERFTPASATEDGETEGPTILYVGRVSPEKGIHVLLDAFERVVADQPSARLKIVGPQTPPPPEFIVDLDDDPRVGELRPLYHSGYRAELEAGMSPEARARTTFIRNLAADDVIREYRRARLVVFPSVWNEPFGMPIVEAMACGLPIVTTRGGGIPEIVEDGVNGILVERGDPRALARALVGLLATPARAREMGARGRESAVRRFGWTQVAEGLRRRCAGPG